MAKGKMRLGPVGVGSCARIGLGRGIEGALIVPSSDCMKSPRSQPTGDGARERTRRFIAGAPELAL